MGEVVALQIAENDDDEGGSRQPRPMDVRIGAGLRLARRSKNETQEGLAKKVGLTFQQIQKYENGTNRLSLSRLLQIFKALEADPVLFVSSLASDDFYNLGESDELGAMSALLSQKGALDILKNFERMKSADRNLLMQMSFRLSGRKRPARIPY